MQVKYKHATALVLLTVIFYALFYKQSAGVNVLIYEVLLMVVLVFAYKANHRSAGFLIVLSTTLLSAFFVALYASAIAIAFNVLSLFVITAYRAAPNLRSPLNALQAAFGQLWHTPADALRSVFVSKSSEAGNLAKWAYRLRITLLPAGILIVFIVLYMVANSRFSHLMEKGLANISDVFLNLFKGFSGESIVVMLCGLFLAAAFLFQQPIARILARDAAASDVLIRKRSTGNNFRMTDLKKEYLTMVLLLVLLNVLILVLNIIDLDWVWLHYQWDGGELKEFVHEGTYLLIVAILFSCAIALHIFRNNLNHFSGNKRLKQLTYLWIGQNIFMALSVAMRTWRYIEHFNLAHLRIGLLYFLMAAIVFMVFILIKIRYAKSGFYLIRKTMTAGFLIAFMLCPFDWDRLIVRYNFAHSDSGFVHKDWTMTLSDKTLPLIGEHLDFMQGQIDSNSWHNGKADNYNGLYGQRVSGFLHNYEQKHWLSLSYAEYDAYRRLKGKR